MNKQPLTLGALHKFCCRCCTTKPVTAFSRIRKGSEVRQSYCKPCKSKQFKEWYAVNRKENIAAVRKWQADPRNKERREAAWKKYNAKRRCAGSRIRPIMNNQAQQYNAKD